MAIFSRDAPIDLDAARRGLARVQHRGPDGDGMWISPSRRALLGHTRLAVIDPATGAQPLASEDGRVHAVVNGEIYDFERIRADLTSRGHVFQTRSDSEILLHLYQERGPACLEDLRGELAFVLWDDVRQRVFAGRDRFGIKPLFYAIWQRALYLASEIKALAAAGVPLSWDTEAYLLQTYLYLPPDRSLFRGVLQVPPGHYLLASPSEPSLHRYWDVDDPAAVETHPEGELVEQLRDALSEAVRLRLRADVPVGCFLSGGLDSSTVAGLAARLAPGPRDVFTVSYDEPGFDEAPVAAETADRLGYSLHVVRATQGLLADHFADTVWHAESIVYGFECVAKYLLARRVREQGVKVVLTGEGADEVFFGYRFLIQDLLQPGAPDGDQEGLQGTLGFVPALFPMVTRRRGAVLRELAPGGLRLSAERAGALFLRALDPQGRLAGWAPIHQSAYLTIKSHLASYILAAPGDRAEMAHAVEVRHPFLDHELFERVRTIPPLRHVGRDPLREKRLLREVARPVLTDTVYRRRKQAFRYPVLRRDDPRMMALLEDQLASRALADLPFFDPRRVAALAAAFRRGEAAEHADALIGVMSACILQERYRVGS